MPAPTAPARPAGTGTRVWLLRHAEVHADWQGRAYGDLDVPLSPAGEARTVEMARAFAGARPAAVHGSPLARARLLGEGLAAGAGVPLALSPDWREIHRGRWQGRRVAELQGESPDEVAAFYADPWGWKGHGGESDAELWARAWPALEAACAEVAGGVVAIATHYNVIRVLVARALGIPPDRSFAFRVDPGRGVLLHDAAASLDAPAGWRLLRSNVLAPPPPLPEEVGST